jgi:hypothetical protein
MDLLQQGGTKIISRLLIFRKIIEKPNVVYTLV